LSEISTIDEGLVCGSGSDPPALQLGSLKVDKKTVRSFY